MDLPGEIPVAVGEELLQGIHLGESSLPLLPENDCTDATAVPVRASVKESLRGLFGVTLECQVEYQNLHGYQSRSSTTRVETLGYQIYFHVFPGAPYKQNQPPPFPGVIQFLPQCTPYHDDPLLTMMILLNVLP